MTTSSSRVVARQNRTCAYCGKAILEGDEHTQTVIGQLNEREPLSLCLRCDYMVQESLAKDIVLGNFQLMVETCFLSCPSCGNRFSNEARLSAHKDVVFCGCYQCHHTWDADISLKSLQKLDPLFPLT